MAFADEFDLDGPADGPWTVRYANTDQVAGRLSQTSDGFQLSDSAGKDLGQFESIDESLRMLFGSD